MSITLFKLGTYDSNFPFQGVKNSEKQDKYTMDTG